MPEESLEEVLGSSINKWFGGATIDVHATFDAMLAVMASIAVRAGCNTPERRTTLADHMKTNLAIQLRLEHDLAKGLVDPSPLGVETVEKMVAAGRQALQTEEPVRVELRNNVPQKIFELAPVEAVMPDTTGENAKEPRE